jgi:hypothetical protein
MNEKICSMCSRKITLNENPSGLVFEDSFFLCENCHDVHSKEELDSWMKTIMHKSLDGMPIALWLIHEQNKDKTIMSMAKNE